MPLDELSNVLGSLENLISISDANSRGLSRLIAEAEEGRVWIVLRGSKPVATVVGIDRLREFAEVERTRKELALTRNELGLLALAISRLLAEGPAARPLAGVTGADPADESGCAVHVVASAAADLAARPELLPTLRDLAANPRAGTSFVGVAAIEAPIRRLVTEAGALIYEWTAGSERLTLLHVAGRDGPDQLPAPEPTRGLEPRTC